MEKNILTSQRTGDKCIHVKHPSGLDIYICEMPGFSSVEALFGTKYGSINTMFKMTDDKVVRAFRHIILCLSAYIHH